MCTFEIVEFFKWKMWPVVDYTESDFRSYPSISRMRIPRVDVSSYHEGVYHIIFITLLLKCLYLVSITTEHLLNDLVVSIQWVGFDFMTWWKFLFCYTKFYIQCSGVHQMILVILPGTPFDTLIFGENHMVLQDFCFHSCIILIKIIGCRLWN